MPWVDIPGYRVIVKTILLEMKEREIVKYPDSLITVSGSLVKNTYLLASFMRLLFKRTNLYDMYSVSATYRILDQWFSGIHA